MKTSCLRRTIGLLILLVSLVLLVWSLLPAERQQRVLPISPDLMSLPTPASYLERSWYS